MGVPLAYNVSCRDSSAAVLGAVAGHAGRTAVCFSAGDTCGAAVLPDSGSLMLLHPLGDLCFPL